MDHRFLYFELFDKVQYIQEWRLSVSEPFYVLNVVHLSWEMVSSERHKVACHLVDVRLWKEKKDVVS